MGDYVKLTIKVEDPETGVIYEHVLDRVQDLVTEQTYPEPDRDPSGLAYPHQAPRTPTAIKVSFVPLADERGIWARTYRTESVDE